MTLPCNRKSQFDCIWKIEPRATGTKCPEALWRRPAGWRQTPPAWGQQSNKGGEYFSWVGKLLVLNYKMCWQTGCICELLFERAAINRKSDHFVRSRSDQSRDDHRRSRRATALRPRCSKGAVLKRIAMFELWTLGFGFPELNLTAFRVHNPGEAPVIVVLNLLDLDAITSKLFKHAI